MSAKLLRIKQNGKLLQHKFIVLSHICRMMATYDLQALRHRSKSRHLRKSVGREAKP
ncbi:hypothetical protein [Microcoleus sp. F4-D5]|uniref:hypothetical protein n=1 Tax=Microcoleus sp. F4-D5 TaxID=2818760 RepID=UPI002FD5744F